ncbi:MAG: S8 family serine peptidase [Rhodothermales bacterium]
MHATRLPRPWIALCVLFALFLSPSLLQGCDALIDAEPSPSQQRLALLGDSGTLTKLSFANELLATDAEWVYLIVGVNEDQGDLEASGVTRRKLNSYDVTRRILTKYDGDAVFRLDLGYTLQAVSLAIRPSALRDVLRDLESDPDVAWIEPDRLLAGDPGAFSNMGSLGQQVSWGVARMNAPRRDASKVDIFVVDSGINASTEIALASSTDFSMYYLARVADVVNPITSLLGLASTTNNLLAADVLGHGTHIAGTIAARDNMMGVRGVAPGTALHNMRVLGPDGQTDMSTVLKAIDEITARKQANPGRPMVVNLSFGADFGSSAYNVLDRAIQRSIEAGVVYVIAAGNDGIDVATVTPAHVAEAITVGAYDQKRRPADFSNHGAGIDLMAPGVDIVSVSHLASWKRVGGSGTSYAAPHVTALAAHYLSQHPSASPAEVLEALRASMP